MAAARGKRRVERRGNCVREGMRIPLLIFVISGIATIHLEPIAARGAEALLHYAHPTKGRTPMILNSFEWPCGRNPGRP
jgi:hypothetical protein